MSQAKPGGYGSFDLLSPDAIASAVEGATGVGTEGALQAYPSYVNRVYGLRLEDGREIIAKFYRPGRWDRDGILDEHRFLADCAAAELPVVSPIAMPGGGTLGELTLEGEGEGESEGESEGGEAEFLFAVFPKMGGRNFDAEGDSDWLRLGALLGRLHAVGDVRAAPSRVRCGPRTLTEPLLDGLLDEGVVHADHRSQLEDVCRRALDALAPRFEGLAERRIHGDCHRGNILDRLGDAKTGDSGLLVIDFDDMMNGPASQDIWLLLPDHASKCRRELALLLEGYESFLPFDRRELALVEGLRLMRMIYFLAWRSRQRGDLWFRSSFPDWGSEAFWIEQIDDLADQAELALEDLRA
jgi:Ser/Thr protein kinase RdoA (MazF antagonist)